MKKRANSNKKVGNVCNPNGTITLKEALKVLKGKSKITKEGLRIAAKRDLFKSIFIGNGKEKFLLDELKFREWIKKTIDVKTPAYVLISIIAKEFDITTAYVYKLIKIYKIKTKVCCAGKGKIFVNLKQFRKIYNSLTRKVSL